jgi:hypothetical protein
VTDGVARVSKCHNDIAEIKLVRLSCFGRVVVLAVLCVVGALVGQKLRNMRRTSSMARKPHIFRGGGHWCATFEQIHRLIGAAIHKFNNLPPDEKPEATRREPNESATGKPYPENVKPIE